MFDDGEIEGKMGALIATYKTELARLDEMEHEDDEEDDEDEDAGDFVRPEPPPPALAPDRSNALTHVRTRQSDKENAPRTAGRAVKRKRHDVRAFPSAPALCHAPLSLPTLRSTAA